MRSPILGVVAAVLFGGGVLLATNNDYTPDPNWKAPPAAAQKRNPLARDPKAALQGKDTFESQCSMCHGADGTGVSNAANLRLQAVQKQSDGTLFWKMTEGNQDKGMPSFKRLPEQLRWQLVTYIRTFRDKPGK
jgi:mono/diheme cytochrome c family protein